MICSFTLGLYPMEEGKIEKYINYDCLKNYLKDELTNEELKNIKVSNFLTRDKLLEEKTYFIKISSIDSEATLKLLKFLFYRKMTNEGIIINGTEFKITNIYHNGFWAKQLDIDEFIKSEFVDEIQLKLFTPTFFKVGSRYVSSIEPIYIFKDLIRKVKKSSIEDKKFLKKIKSFDVDKVKIISDETELRPIWKYKTKGLIGKVTYKLTNYSDDELLSFNFLLHFAFFSGIGYLTERGYGQVMEIEGDN